MHWILFFFKLSFSWLWDNTRRTKNPIHFLSMMILLKNFILIGTNRLKFWRLSITHNHKLLVFTIRDGKMDGLFCTIPQYNNARSRGIIPLSSTVYYLPPTVFLNRIPISFPSSLSAGGTLVVLLILLFLFIVLQTNVPPPDPCHAWSLY